MIGKGHRLDGQQCVFEKWEHNEVNILTRTDLLSGDVHEALERQSDHGSKTDGRRTDLAVQTASTLAATFPK